MDRFEEAQKVLREADCLHAAAAIQAAYARLAEVITREYAGKNPFFLCVMIGGLVPTAEIIKRLDFAFELDYLHATRYRGQSARKYFFTFDGSPFENGFKGGIRRKAYAFNKHRRHTNTIIKNDAHQFGKCCRVVSGAPNGCGK